MATKSIVDLTCDTLNVNSSMEVASLTSDSISVTGAVSGATGSFTGAVSAGPVTSTGDVSGASLTTLGAVSGGSGAITGALTAGSIAAPIITPGSTTLATTGTDTIPATHDIVFIDSSGAVSTLSLAAAAAGTTKTIIMTVAGNAATLSKANGNLGGSVATSIVFDAVGESACLVSVGATWEVVSSVGATIT